MQRELNSSVRSERDNFLLLYPWIPCDHSHISSPVQSRGVIRRNATRGLGFIVPETAVEVIPWMDTTEGGDIILR